jgi:hypothetical protein
MDTLVASRKDGVVIGAAYTSAVPSTFTTWSTTVVDAVADFLGDTDGGLDLPLSGDLA